VQVLTGRRYRVEELVFSPDGQFLAAAGGSGVHVWDLAAPPGMPPVEFPFACPLDVAFLTADRLLVRNWANLHLCNPRTRAERKLALKMCGQPRAVASADGRRVAGCGQGSSLRVWDVAAGPTLSPRVSVPAKAVREYRLASFFPAGDRLAVFEVWHRPGRRPTRWLTVRDADTGKRLAAARCGYTLPDWLGVSPDGSRVLVQSGPSFTAWDADDLTATPRSAVIPGRARIRGMAFHPSGALLASSDDSGTVRFWDAATLGEVRAFGWKVGKPRAVAFSPDGTRAAVGSHTGRVLVWDVDV
jgi:WD40 repeat protein